MNQFRPVTMIARSTPGTHNPRISAHTVTHRLREIGERTHIQLMFYMRRFFFGLVYVSQTMVSCLLKCKTCVSAVEGLKMPCS